MAFGNRNFRLSKRMIIVIIQRKIRKNVRSRRIRTIITQIRTIMALGKDRMSIIIHAPGRYPVCCRDAPELVKSVQE